VIKIPKHFESNKGRLVVGGCDTTEIIKKFGTPLYVLDENYIRNTCKEYISALGEYGNGLIAYAGKALLCKKMCKIVASEGLGLDVVSGGELATALQAGFDTSKIYFHGNNKSRQELEMAVKANVHAIVIDSFFEIDLLNDVCKKLGKKQAVLVRSNPGVEAHTHHYIQTAKVDSKFGFFVDDGTAEKAIATIAKSSFLNFLGLHCHIGSQIFEVTPFELAAKKMIDFAAKVKAKLGVTVSELNLGGGFGIEYIDEDRPLTPKEYIGLVAKQVKDYCKTKDMPQPKLIFEPGRSIVGPAGVTLYTVGAIKDIPNVRKYISVDGGMHENPRHALYQAQYKVALANRLDETCTEKITIAGKCCESGDMLARDVMLPPVKSGDNLVIFSTGAYNYSMASNYNRNLIPPIVLVNKGKAEYMIRPQTYDDIMNRDV